MIDNEEPLAPHNEIEFVGDCFKATRFILSRDEKPEKLIFLMINDEIIGLTYQNSDAS